ncbi:MAG: hypothetical protein ACLR76_00545 [Alistipes sp.]
MTENYENYNWFERYDTWTEPCAIVDSYLLATQLWAATRNPAYLEDADKIYLNGIAATQRHNGGFGCDKPVGVVYPELGIHADEAYWCCTMRGGEGLGRAAEYSYFTEGNQIVVPFYRESRLRLPDRNVALEQRTDYPFGDRVEFRFAEKPDKEVSLALAVPSYMQLRSLTLNGHPVEASVSEGFAEVAGPFSAGDRIELEYGFAARWSTARKQGHYRPDAVQGDVRSARTRIRGRSAVASRRESPDSDRRERNVPDRRDPVRALAGLSSDEPEGMSGGELPAGHNGPHRLSGTARLNRIKRQMPPSHSSAASVFTQSSPCDKQSGGNRRA